MEYTLKSETFQLSIKLKVFEDDIDLPTNTIMEITVESKGFSASTTMDINIKDFAKFSNNLYEVYKKLYGEAKIQEQYGMNMFISFVGDKKGHIFVEGYLNSNDQVLNFKNSIDQTELKEFCYNLKNNYSKYL